MDLPPANPAKIKHLRQAVELMLTLMPVTSDNYDAALELGVAPDQQRFVAPIVKSLADSAVWVDARLRVARHDDVLIGYMMIFPFDRDGEKLVNIVRLMIDQRFQGRGLGRKLLIATLEETVFYAPDRIRISADPANHVALSLYESVGFVQAGMEEGEVALYRKP